MSIVIRFRVRTSAKKSKTELHYIYCRLTVNRVQARSDMATGVSCLPEEWDNKAQRVRGYSDSVRQQNAKLDQIRNDLDTIYNEMRKYDKPITAEVIKQAYTSKQDPTPRTLLVYYQKFIDEVKSEEVKENTLEAWESRLKTLETYITNSLKRKDVDLAEVNGEWLKEYQKYHRKQGNCYNHSARAVGSIKAVLDFGVVKNVLPFNPTLSFRAKRDKSKPIKFLTNEQVRKLADCPYYDNRLQRVVDCFLVQVYTGMAYNELVAFRQKEHIKTDAKGMAWIMIYRGKTNELSTIPLLKTARELMEKYNYQLPVVSNQKMNDYIKEAAIVAGVEKAEEISTHVARKTAGMYLLNAGLRIESVSKILGHKSVKVTERYYATLLTDSLAEDLRRNGLI